MGGGSLGLKKVGEHSLKAVNYKRIISKTHLKPFTVKILKIGTP